MNLILQYHNLIRDEDVDENLYRRSYEGAPLLYYRKVSYFEEDIKNQKIISLYDLPAEGTIITFDDGRIDNYEIAFPILERLGHTATFFIATAKIGSKGYMTWKQVKELSKRHSIESHTHSHKPLSELTPKEIEYELNESSRLIKKHTGKRARFVSLPAGRRFNREIAKKCGYQGIRTSERGLNEELDMYELEAYPMTNNALLK